MEKGILGGIQSYVASCLNQETIPLASLSFIVPPLFHWNSPLLALASLIEFSFLAEYLRSLPVLIYSTITRGWTGIDGYSAILVNVSQSAMVGGKRLISSIFWYPWCKYYNHGWFQAANVMSLNTELGTMHTIGSCVYELAPLLYWTASIRSNFVHWLGMWTILVTKW